MDEVEKRPFARPKGLPKTGGRKKGSKNKFNLKAKESFDMAFNDSGGTRALTEWAKLNRTDFYRLYAKKIPQEQEISGPKGEPIQVTVVTEFVKP